MQKQGFFDNFYSTSNTGYGRAYGKSDYYCFGSPMTGRVYQAIGTGKYRYGFNGMEKDDEISGDGNNFTSHYRGYNSGLGRWWSTDPEEDKFPEFSPYQNNEDNPVINADPNGNCPWCIVFVGLLLVADVAVAPTGNPSDKPAIKAAQKQHDNQVVAALAGGTLGTIATVANKPVPKLNKAEQVKRNAQKGEKFDKQVGKKLKKTQENVTPQITVKTKSGTKTKIDYIGKDKTTGKDVLTEAKSSPTAPLTKNQKTAFSEIEQTGGIVVGQGKPPYTGGTEILPSLVKILRPGTK